MKERYIVIGILVCVIGIGGGGIALAAWVFDAGLLNDGTSSWTKSSRGLSTKPAVPEVTYKRLAAFPDAGPTWKDKFVKGADIPENKFRVYYFNSQNPTVVVKADVVNSVDVNYNYTDGPGFTINSQDFGAYWIGRFATPVQQKMDLTIDLSWSEARVIIDGKEVYKKNSDGSEHLVMPAGTHTMEVEFVNNWHTTTFSVSLTPANELTTDADFRKAVYVPSIQNVWFAGVYESSSFDNSIKLIPKAPITAPTVLFLDSYSAVHWDLSALSSASVTAIVVSSYAPGSKVIAAPPLARVFHMELPLGYEMKGNCTTIATVSTCENLRDFTVLNARIKAIMGGKAITGFSGAYSSSSLVLPETLIDAAKEAELLSYPTTVQQEAQRKEKANTLEGTF
jgi:hypothetical protein